MSNCLNLFSPEIHLSLHIPFISITNMSFRAAFSFTNQECSLFPRVPEISEGLLNSHRSVKSLTLITVYPSLQSGYTIREYFLFIHLVRTVQSLHFTRRFASSPWKLRDQLHHFRPHPQPHQPSLISPPTSLCLPSVRGSPCLAFTCQDFNVRTQGQASSFTLHC
jgi:hypothetical protein